MVYRLGESSLGRLSMKYSFCIICVGGYIVWSERLHFQQERVRSKANQSNSLIKHLKIIYLDETVQMFWEYNQGNVGPENLGFIKHLQIHKTTLFFQDISPKIPKSSAETDFWWLSCDIQEILNKKSTCTTSIPPSVLRLPRNINCKNTTHECIVYKNQCNEVKISHCSFKAVYGGESHVRFWR